jgi:hypothetical protein
MRICFGGGFADGWLSKFESFTLFGIFILRMLGEFIKLFQQHEWFVGYARSGTYKYSYNGPYVAILKFLPLLLPYSTQTAFTLFP